MGRFINPGNEGFAKITQAKYVDKTGLITLFDKTLDSTDGFVMVSRPRRFGKSFAAKSLVAFYSCSCDSRSLFEGYEVSRRENWDDHLNGLNVVSLDMTEIIKRTGPDHVSDGLENMLLEELRELMPEAGKRAVLAGDVLFAAFDDVVKETGRKFVFIIDEWDAPYRLAKGNRVAQDAYAELLRALFKGNTFTPAVVAGAYLTGILPIKKYAHQSAVSDFNEFTMLDPGPYAPFAGFLDDEICALCEGFDLETDKVRSWYDGYELRFRGIAYDVYAPYSVMRACQRGRVGSYWVSTESFDSLLEYIDMDFDGLQEAITRAVSGEALRVDTHKFQNDLTSLCDRDDVLTLLIHLGYLAYDADAELARVPNEEVRLELARAIANSRHPRLVEIMSKSARLLDDVVNRRAEAVAKRFQEAHEEEAAPLFYNNEQALRSVVKNSLVAAVDEYARIEELPSGKGYADVVYLPKRGSAYPALLVELKWDKPVEAAVEQARERNYARVLQQLDVPALLVGVTYNAKTKEHVCHIAAIGDA